MNRRRLRTRQRRKRNGGLNARKTKKKGVAGVVVIGLVTALYVIVEVLLRIEATIPFHLVN